MTQLTATDSAFDRTAPSQHLGFFDIWAGTSAGLAATGFQITGSTQVVEYDLDDDENWTTQTSYYNAVGALVGITQELDDGHSTETVVDPTPKGSSDTNARSWHSKTATYDSDGALVSYATAWDDTDLRVFFYTEGQLTSDRIFDGSDTRNWEYRRIDYDDAGRVDQDLFIFDSGVTRKRTYDDEGTMRSLNYADVSGDKPYNNVHRTYGEDGLIDTAYTIKDNFDHVDTKYDEFGLRVTRTLYDHSRTKDYESRTYTYDSAGNVTSIMDVPDVLDDWFVL